MLVSSMGERTSRERTRSFRRYKPWIDEVEVTVWQKAIKWLL